MQHLRRYSALALILTVLCLHIWVYEDFFVDDAYISLRYVQQWTAGNGLVYNLGEYVEGYSNFLWIVLISGTHLVGLDLITASRLWGLGLSVATFLLSYWFVRDLPFSLFTPMLLAVSGPYAMWSVGGLEIPLFMFLAFLGTVLFYYEEQKNAGWISGLIWGLLALTRPEGLLFAGIALLYRLFRLHRMNLWPQPHDYGRALALVSIVVPHLLWRLSYYGYPVPNTYYAKSVGFRLRTFLEGGYYLFQSLEVIGGFLFVGLLVTLAILAHKKYSYVNYFTLNVSAYFFFIFLAGGDWMPAQRFLVNVLPILTVILHTGAVELVSLFTNRIRILVWLVIVSQILYVGAISINTRFISPGLSAGHRLSRPYAWVAYLEERITPNDTIAVLDAGQVAYRLPLSVRVVDMVGLADGHIAHREAQFPGGLMGRGDAWGKWDVDYILEQNPRYIQMHPGTFDDQGNYKTGFTGTTLLVNDPRFRGRYKETEIRGIFQRTQGN